MRESCATSCAGTLPASSRRARRIRMPSGVATLYLIRHGQASYGEVDYDRLSTKGRDQAAELGRLLGGARLNSVYAGPLVRQQQTIEVAAEAAAAAGMAL